MRVGLALRIPGQLLPKAVGGAEAAGDDERERRKSGDHGTVHQRASVVRGDLVTRFVDRRGDRRRIEIITHHRHQLGRQVDIDSADTGNLGHFTLDRGFTMAAAHSRNLEDQRRHHCLLRSQQSFDGLRRLVNEVFGAIAVATRCRAGDAVVQVLVEQLDADALQRLADRRDLRQHIDAVRVFLDHPRQPADLALDAVEARQQLLLVV